MDFSLQLWGNVKKSNLNKIQTFQNIALRKLINVPSYVSNYTLHTDLKLKTINEEATFFYKRFHSLLAFYTNLLIQNLAPLTTLGSSPRCCNLLQEYINTYTY